jgi:hypothetical protein
MKCVSGLMFSAGLRIGAIPQLRLRNLEKIDNLYKITVYEGSKEMYYSFCSPECGSFIDTYLQYRSKSGEMLNPESYLIRDQFDITDIEQVRDRSKGITTGTLKVTLNTLLVKAGLRTVDHASPHKRKEVARAHGFRKFYTNQLVESNVITEHRWQLEGHKLKGNDSYYIRTSEKKLYEEYKKAIDNLTIDPANRLISKVKTLEIEKNRLDRLEQSLSRLEQKYNEV